MKKLLLSLGIFAMCAATTVHAELIQQFKDPTFSGNGWSTQVLTLEQMRESAKAQVKSSEAAAASAAAAATANTPAARFMALFTSQMYSQLSTQLTNNMFNTCKDANGAAIAGCTPALNTGKMVIDPNTNSTVEWKKLDANQQSIDNADRTTVAKFVQVTVTVPGQNPTYVIVPIAAFSF
jgi:hypothetical protein